jgi:regulatory protein
MPPRPASIKVRALQWLAQREHSRDELRGKLLRLLQRRPAGAGEGEGGGEGEGEARAAPATHHPLARAAACQRTDSSTDPSTDPPVGPSVDPATEVDNLLLWLETHGHLSQARFVESRVNARQTRFGNLRIRQELRHHGVALDADAQQALQRSEFDRAREVWRKKYGSLAEDAAARVRQMRFLAGRGFSIDVVRRVVRIGAAGDTDDDSSAG